MSYNPERLTPIEAFENITNESRENLKKLSTFLKANANALKFDMTTYNGDELLPGQLDTSNHCGTVGCALGFAPFAGIPFDEGDSWPSYSKRFTTIDNPEYKISGDFIYEWCFSCDWEYIDNTALGAARRIDDLLERPQYVADHFVENGVFYRLFAWDAQNAVNVLAIHRKDED
uniref:Uncharacterized protein n=1 Tax=Rhizobium phage IG49 TaxID=3129228 RepID=A0AAU8HZ25_9CAUD